MNTKKILPTVQVLAAVSNEGTVISAVGIEEDSTIVQVYVPGDYFSEQEKEKFNIYEKRSLEENNSVMIAETEAYHFRDMQFDMFDIRIVKVPFDISKAL